MPMTLHRPRRIHSRAADIVREGSMIQTLLVLAVGLAVFGAIVIFRKVHASHMPDSLSPQVLTRINAEYSEQPQ
jgi:hypothetical protein